MPDESTIERCLLRCADCQNIVTGMERVDGRIVPVGGHKCKICNGEDFDRMTLPFD